MQPISVAVEEKIVTTVFAVSITGDPSGQVIVLGSSFRGGHVCARPNVKTVQPGLDMQLLSVPYHSTPLSSRVIGHVNPQGGRPDIAELGRVIHLVSPVIAAVQAGVLHIPGVHDIIHCLVLI